MKLRQAVILAGGLGTRMRPLTDTLPKPMIPINGRPFISYLFELLKENSITEVVLCLGYLPEKIIEYCGDGTRFGMHINYSVGDVSFETGKRLKHALSLLDDHFLPMYCDNYAPLNLRKLLEFHAQHNVLATLTAYSNKDNATKNNIHVDEHGFVTCYDKTRTSPGLNAVDIAFFIMSKKVVEAMPDTNISLTETQEHLVAAHQLAAYATDHKYYSLGSIERLPLTSEYLKEKKVLFLDRDGVINKKPPKADYVKHITEFEFLPGAKEAIALLTQKGYELYLISNQAGIARQKMTEADLASIHAHMLQEIEKYGGKIKKIYYCPHGWDAGCMCRKPKPGMLFQAAYENHLNLTKSLFVGDDEHDQQAAEAADVPFAFIDNASTSLLSVAQQLQHDTETR